MKKIIIKIFLLFFIISCTATIPSQQISQTNAQLFTIEPTPVQMPKLIKNNIRKIAIISPKLNSPSEKEWQTSVEEVFDILPQLRTNIKFLERDQIDRILSELELQKSGLVAEQEAIRIGRLLGADHIILYEFSTASDADIRRMQSGGGTFVSLVKIKIVDVETSEVIFSKISKTLAILHFPLASGGLFIPQLPEMVRRVSVEYCSYISSVALNAAFNPNNIGIVFDFLYNSHYKGRGAKVAFTLTQGPAERSGIKKGDIVLQMNGKDINDFLEAVPLTYTFPPNGSIVIERNGQQYQLLISF